MGTHNGTHADAPFHYLPDGESIDVLDPALFVGPALVVDVSAAGWSITRAAFGSMNEGVTRLLLKTGAWPDSTQFPARIPTLAPDVPAWLGNAACGCWASMCPRSTTSTARLSRSPRAGGGKYLHHRIAGPVGNHARRLRIDRAAAAHRRRRRVARARGVARVMNAARRAAIPCCSGSPGCSPAAPPCPPATATPTVACARSGCARTRPGGRAAHRAACRF